MLAFGNTLMLVCSAVVSDTHRHGHRHTNEINRAAPGIAIEVTEKDSPKCVYDASIIHDMASAIILLGI